jgi:hypothetical protein
MCRDCAIQDQKSCRICCTDVSQSKLEESRSAKKRVEKYNVMRSKNMGDDLIEAILNLSVISDGASEINKMMPSVKNGIKELKDLSVKALSEVNRGRVDNLVNVFIQAVYESSALGLKFSNIINKIKIYINSDLHDDLINATRELANLQDDNASKLCLDVQERCANLSNDSSIRAELERYGKSQRAVYDVLKWIAMAAGACLVMTGVGAGAGVAAMVAAGVIGGTVGYATVNYMADRAEESVSERYSTSIQALKRSTTCISRYVADMKERSTGAARWKDVDRSAILAQLHEIAMATRLLSELCNRELRNI